MTKLAKIHLNRLNGIKLARCHQHPSLPELSARPGPLNNLGLIPIGHEGFNAYQREECMTRLGD